MNSGHGRTLGCCSELLFMWGAQGRGKGETVQKEPTYTCEKLAACSPRRQSLTILTLRGGIFQFLTLQNTKFPVSFLALLIDQRKAKQRNREPQQNKKNMRIFQIVKSFDYPSFTYLCVCVWSVIF